MARKKQNQQNQKKQNEESVTGELGTLSPKPVMWDIGDKLFEQEPLRIDALSDVMEEITDILLSQGSGAILNKIVDSAADGLTDSKIDLEGASMSVLIRTVVGIPRRLPKIVSLILETDEQHIRDHVKARQAVQIVKTFIEQNEIGALIQDFFGLVSSVNLSINQATEEAEKEKETETVLPSDSETTEETEEA